MNGINTLLYHNIISMNIPVVKIRVVLPITAGCKWGWSWMHSIVLFLIASVTATRSCEMKHWSESVSLLVLADTIPMLLATIPPLLQWPIAPSNRLCLSGIWWDREPQSKALPCHTVMPLPRIEHSNVRLNPGQMHSSSCVNPLLITDAPACR